VSSAAQFDRTAPPVALRGWRPRSVVAGLAGPYRCLFACRRVRSLGTEVRGGPVSL